MKTVLTGVLCISMCLGFSFSGCDTTSTPSEVVSLGISGGQANGTPTGEDNIQGVATTTCTFVPQSVVLAGFTITYNGRTVANDQTTFTYVVTGPHQDFKYRLELPSCAPPLAALLPSNGDLDDNILIPVVLIQEGEASIFPFLFLLHAPFISFRPFFPCNS